MQTTEEILSDKAFDQIAHLTASYDAGKIDAKAFAIGIETVWACVGGMIELEAFQALMKAANEEVRGLPVVVEKTLVHGGSGAMLIARDRHQMWVYHFALKGSKAIDFDTEEEAIAQVRKMTDEAMAKGLKVC